MFINSNSVKSQFPCWWYCKWYSDIDKKWSIKNIDKNDRSFRNGFEDVNVETMLQEYRVIGRVVVPIFASCSI